MVLEIGAGVGTLTLELSKIAGRVVAFEKDRKLLQSLELVLRKFKNVEVLIEDFLEFDLQNHLPPTTHYKLISNIPYYITGQILRKIFSAKEKPSLVVLLVQKEVAERIVAKPGNLNMLALSVQFYGNPKIISVVSKESFYPAPDVDSAILKIKVFNKPKIGAGSVRVSSAKNGTITTSEGSISNGVNEKNFFRLARVGFASKRKTILNNISSGLKIEKVKTKKILEKAGIDPKFRPQELSFYDWERLLNEINKNEKQG